MCHFNSGVYFISPTKIHSKNLIECFSSWSVTNLLLKYSTSINLWCDFVVTLCSIGSCAELVSRCEGRLSWRLFPKGPQTQGELIFWITSYLCRNSHHLTVAVSNKQPAVVHKYSTRAGWLFQFFLSFSTKSDIITKPEGYHWRMGVRKEINFNQEDICPHYSNSNSCTSVAQSEITGSYVQRGK